MISLVTEISTIFGLTLLEMIEYTMFLIPGAIIAAAGITGTFSLISILQNKKNLEMQNKIASASLIHKHLEPWDKNKRFKQMILKLETPNAVFTDEDQVHFVLAKFEDIAILRQDKLFTETHVQEFFGRDIVRIGANESVMKILDEYYNEDRIHNYNNLKKLLDDSKKWGMNPYSSEESSLVSS